jgi:RNA polymerase sigma-70 factor (ECF subfamily)
MMSALRSMLTAMQTQMPEEKDEAEAGIVAFEAVFKEHWSLVYGVVVRVLGDPDDAEDLSLEIFYRLYRKFQCDAELAKIHNLRAWLYRTATNQALNGLRSRRRRAHYERQAGAHALAVNPVGNPVEEVERVEERSRVRAVLAEMKARDAQLLLLRHTGLSYAEVAEAVGVAPSSVGTLLARAESAFEKRYRELEG